MGCFLILLFQLLWKIFKWHKSHLFYYFSCSFGVIWETLLPKILCQESCSLFFFYYKEVLSLYIVSDVSLKLSNPFWVCFWSLHKIKSPISFSYMWMSSLPQYQSLRIQFFVLYCVFLVSVVLWMTNALHWLRHLNTWFPSGGAIWRSCGEVQPYWKMNVTGGQALRIKILAPPSVWSLCFVLVVELWFLICDPCPCHHTWCLLPCSSLWWAFIPLGLWEK